MLIHFPPALRHKRYRLIWFGQIVSFTGSQMQLWALFWHIRLLTDEPIALGGIGLARILPILIFSLMGGVVADTADRRKVMFITQTFMALFALSLAVLTFNGTITLWHIYLLTALQAIAISFDSPSRQALVPNLVPARDLANAFSLNSIALQTGAFVGPAIGGWVIALLGIGYTYLFNAVSFGAVLVSLILIGPIAQQFQPKREAERVLAVSIQSIREGVQFILTNPIIFSTMVLDFFATFFSSANTLMPIMAVDVLHVGEIEYGWLSSGQAIGAGLAAIVLSQIPQIRRQGPLFLVSVMLFGLATIWFGLARSFPIAMLALVLIGASDSVSTIIRNTIRQMLTPDYIRGRMTSINQIFFMGGPQLGEVEAGIVAQLFSGPIAIVSGGVGCLIAVTWTVWKWPQLLQFNGDEAAAVRAGPGTS